MQLKTIKVPHPDAQALRPSSVHMELMLMETQKVGSSIWMPFTPAQDSGIYRVAIRSYLAASAALGFLIGLVGGLSSSPIVGIALPLLFALIAGTGGMYLGRADLSTTESLRHIRVLGLAIATLSLSVLIGGALGVVLRLHHSSSGELTPRELSEAAPEDYIELLILQRKLALIGANRNEQVLAIQKASLALRRWQGNVPITEVEWFLTRATSSVAAIDKLIENAHQEKLVPPENLLSLAQNLRDFAASLSPWVHDASLGGMPKDRLYAAQKNVFYAVVELSRFGKETNVWLRTRMSMNDLNELFARIDLELWKLREPEWKTGEPQAKELDQLIGILANRKNAASENQDDILPSIEDKAASAAK